MNNQILKKAIASLVALRIVALIVCAFLPLSLPGIWRQTDTMGVALRYWLRWTVEQNPTMPLLPAVLNSGDTSGINAMEFPLLNLLFAPAFALGPYWGKVLGMVGIVILVHGLIYVNYRIWKAHRETLGVDSFGFFLMAIATFSSGWTGKFIPDFISVLLMLLGVGLSWSRPRSFLSGISCAVGILMKPTSVVVLALYLAHPKIIEKIKTNFIWGTTSVLIGLAYYTLGMNYIRQYQEGPGLFAVGMQPFFHALIAFFSDVKNWTNMWMYRPFFSLGPIIILPLTGIAIVKKFPGYKRYLAIWATLIVQYVVAAGLSGAHGFGHDYYFLGLAPTSALLLWWLLSQQWPKAIPVIVFIGMTIPTLELSSMDLKPLYKKALHDELELANTCREIKERHPEVPWNQGIVFRSSNEEYPSLGLCFGERQGGQKTKYGFFWNASLPTQCNPIEATKLLTFAECSGS